MTEPHDYIKNPDIKELARKINSLISQSDKSTDKLSKMDNTDVDITENRPSNEHITDQTGGPLPKGTDADLSQYTLVTDLALESGSELVGHHTSNGSVHTVHDILDHIIPNWKIGGGVITDDGGLDISWTQGNVYDNETHNDILDFAAGSDTLTDNAINYIYYDTSANGGDLSVSTTKPDHKDPLIGFVMCQKADIWGILTNDPLNSAIEEVIEGLGVMFPTFVISGMVVSPHATPLSLSMTTGHLHKFVRAHFEPDAINSNTLSIVRWYHTSAGVWDYDSNALVDTANYDDQTNRVAIVANKYVKHSIYFGANKLHMIYADAYYTTVAQAIAASSPILPPGLETMVSLVDIVVQFDDLTLPLVTSDQWIDTRPTLNGGGINQGVVTSHLNLTDIGAYTHAQIDTFLGGTIDVDINLSEELHLVDSKKIYLGSGDDLELYHDGGSSRVTNNTGGLYVQNTVGNFYFDTGRIIYTRDIDLGGVVLFKLDTSARTFDMGASGNVVTSTQHGISYFNSYTGNTVAVFESTDGNASIAIKDNDTTAAGYVKVEADADYMKLYAYNAEKIRLGETQTTNYVALKIVGNVGFYNTTPATQQTYSVTNVTTDRTFDANTVAIAELADIVGTLINDLQTNGLLG